jgi:hypothetical protein
MTNDDSVQIAASSPCDGARSPGCGETTARRGPNGKRIVTRKPLNNLLNRRVSVAGSRRETARGKNGVARKWRRNGLIRLNPRREMVWSRKRRPTRSGTGACGSLARLQLTFRGPAERLAREARRALGVGCRLGSRVDQGRRRTRSWSLSRGGGAMEAEIFRLAKP